MRTLKINNSKLVEYLKENGKIANEINKIVTQWQKTDEYVKKLSMKMERIKEKIRPLVAEELKKLTELEEFEIVMSSKLKGKEVVVDIADQVELYKEQLRKQKYDNEKSTDNKEQTGVNTESGSGEGEEKKD